MSRALAVCSKWTDISKIILTIALIFVLLFSGATLRQNTPTHNSAKAAPKIGMAFSKAAIKTGEESLADPNHTPAGHGANEAHDEDQACIVAWVPKLRALSAGIPKQCP